MAECYRRRGQIHAVEALLKRWRGSAAVLINAEWRGDVKAVQGHTSFAKSFKVVYAYEPILVQVPIIFSSVLFVADLCHT